jgi:hypothetical protein
MRSILCRVKCCGMCWLASRWRDAFCDACKQWEIVHINHLNKGVTFSFRCQQGVKQGCPFNPLLFGLYLDALEGHLDDIECVTTLAFGSRPRQGLAKAQAKSEAQESHFMLPGGWEYGRVRELNLHIPKWTPTLWVRVLKDF